MGGGGIGWPESIGGGCGSDAGGTTGGPGGTPGRCGRIPCIIGNKGGPLPGTGGGIGMPGLPVISGNRPGGIGIAGMPGGGMGIPGPPGISGNRPGGIGMPGVGANAFVALNAAARMSNKQILKILFTQQFSYL